MTNHFGNETPKCKSEDLLLRQCFCGAILIAATKTVLLQSTTSLRLNDTLPHRATWWLCLNDGATDSPTL